MSIWTNRRTSCEAAFQLGLGEPSTRWGTVASFSCGFAVAGAKGAAPGQVRVQSWMGLGLKVAINMKGRSSF